MPFIIRESHTIEVESRLLSLAVSKDGLRIAYALADGNAYFCDQSGIEISCVEIEGRAGLIVARPNGGFVIGAIEGNLSAFDSDGNPAWTYAIGGGVEELCAESATIACLDGAGEIHLLDLNGTLKAKLNSSNAEKLSFDSGGRSLAVISSDGWSRTYSPNGESQIEREPRSDHGERVTAICFDASGHLVIARETLGLAGQDEDEVEIEWWTPLGERVDIQGLDTRCTCLHSFSTGVLAGTFSGEVFLLGRNQDKVELWKSDYAISSLLGLGKDILVASWFHLYRISSEIRSDANDEPKWQVESPGIVDFLVTDNSKSLICIGGEDRNDYTGEEPILILNPHAEPIWQEEGSSDPWIQDLELSQDGTDPVGELDLSDDYSEFLTEEEQQQMASGLSPSDSRDDKDLMSDLTDAFEVQLEDKPNSEEEDIMAGLIEDVGKHRISPVANSGEDRKVSLGADESAVVKLDGSDSYDPHERIQRWLWKDGRGKTIGEVKNIRVRLSKGKHRFELSVLDDDGVWTTDTTFITVE